MTDISTIASDPRWLPHKLDLANGRLEFIRIERAALSDTGFLADRTGELAAIPLADLSRIEPQAAPLHFIFHTAFCRSTLLVRALEQPGLAAGLSEPGIIGSLAGAGQAGMPLVGPVADLLARPWAEGEAVFVKPTNHANALIPALMDAAPQARAILMTNPLPSFLAAVIRKGMLGRRWARQLYLEMMGYAGMDIGMDAREQFAMTDLQAGGLAWLLGQRYLDAIARRYGDRVRVLDGDRFDTDRAQTLEAVGSFTGIGLDAARAKAIADGPVFARDAKTGSDFAAKAKSDAAAIRSAVVEDEIAKVGEWIGIIARQAGIEVPVRQTLF